MGTETAVRFTELPEDKQRDFILFVGLGKILEDDAGLSAEDVLTPEEEARLEAKFDTLTNATDETMTAAIALTKAMFIEVKARLLSGEVAA